MPGSSSESPADTASEIRRRIGALALVTCRGECIAKSGEERSSGYSVGPNERPQHHVSHCTAAERA